ncbi:MAG: hypothetical protein J6K39_01500 [Clostridia bacterium]|nr:hypothetical protein [Clostridia bacterium]
MTKENLQGYKTDKLLKMMYSFDYKCAEDGSRKIVNRFDDNFSFDDMKHGKELARSVRFSLFVRDILKEETKILHLPTMVNMATKLKLLEPFFEDFNELVCRYENQGATMLPHKEMFSLCHKHASCRTEIKEMITQFADASNNQQSFKTAIQFFTEKENPTLQSFELVLNTPNKKDDNINPVQKTERDKT